MYQGLVNDIKINRSKPVLQDIEFDEPDEYWDNGAKTFKTEVED